MQIYIYALISIHLSVGKGKWAEEWHWVLSNCKITCVFFYVLLHNFLWPQQAYKIYVLSNPLITTEKILAAQVWFESKGGIVKKPSSFFNIADWFSFFNFSEYFQLGFQINYSIVTAFKHLCINCPWRRITYLCYHKSFLLMRIWVWKTTKNLVL